MDAESLPIRGLEELEIHLESLLTEPGTPLKEKLVDEVDLQITLALVPKLLPNSTKLLYAGHCDPTPLCSLISKLIKPLNFTTILTLASEESLIAALRSNTSEAANRLTLSIISKASASSADVAILSLMRNLVKELIRAWLSKPAVGTGQHATDVLGDLLAIDCERKSVIKKGGDISLKRGSPGQGLLWRRLFHDVEIYRMMFDLCCSKGEETDDEKQVSIAQARLLRLLARIASLDFHAVSHTNFPTIDSQYIQDPTKQGILYWAAVCMVDQNDMLMRLTHVDFIIELLAHLGQIEMQPANMKYLADILHRCMEMDKAHRILRENLETMAKDPEADQDTSELMRELAVEVQNLDLRA